MKFIDRLPTHIANLLPTELWLIIEWFVKKEYITAKRIICNKLYFPYKEFLLLQDDRNRRVIETLSLNDVNSAHVTYYKTLNVTPSKFKYTFLNCYKHNKHIETVILFIRTTRVRNVRPMIRYNWFESQIEAFENEDTYHIKLVAYSTARNETGFISRTHYNIIPIPPPGIYL